VTGGDAGLPDVLQRIVARRRERYAGLSEPALAERAEPLAPSENAFLAALAAPGRDAKVIAEIKMGSPRLGSLAGRVEPLAQAEIYADVGAAALSVVVEPDFFDGSYALLTACRAACGLPAIAKDFVVHPRQLVEAREAGAAAVLLVAALYDAGELALWARRARGLGLVPLVETHDAADVDKLADAPWELVGVNHRDLRTFAVDLERGVALLPRLPPGALKVAESGIASGADVARLSRAGFDAFLVGESLLLAADPAALLGELVARAEEVEGTQRQRAVDAILDLRRDSTPTTDAEIARLREEARRDAGC
jgi:indole-3-glycerol phosphate synthase